MSIRRNRALPRGLALAAAFAAALFFFGAPAAEAACPAGATCTTLPNFSAAAAASDSDLVAVNQGGSASLKQPFTAIWTWIETHVTAAYVHSLGGQLTASTTVSTYGTVGSPTTLATGIYRFVTGGSISANGYWQLPAASNFNVGDEVVVTDGAGILGTFSLTLVRAGTDLINGGATFPIAVQNGAAIFVVTGNGASGTWAAVGGSTIGGVTCSSQAITAIPATSGLPTCTSPAFSWLTGQASLAQLPSIGADTVLGNNTGSTATPIALSQAQITALITSFSSSLSGAVPSSGGGTANFLRADGGWAAPPGTGGGITWPSNGDIVIANGTSSPAGVAEVDGDCVKGVSGSWAASSSCGSGAPPAGATNALQYNAGSGSFGGLSLSAGQIAVGTAGAPVASAFPYAEVWLTSGTTWTSPSWVTANTNIFVEMLGGGGGGSGCNTASDFSPGGAAGGYLILQGTNLIAASTGYTYAIGAAGTAGTATPTGGGNGGDTTLTIGATTYTAHGGTGSAACGNGAAASAGGTAVNGTLNIAGAPGWYTASGKISVGGSSKYGGGGIEPNASTPANATGYGSGGWGGTGTGAVGGLGTQGLAHIVASGI